MIRSMRIAGNVVLGGACLLGGGCAMPWTMDEGDAGLAATAASDGAVSSEEVRDFNTSIARALEAEGQLDRAAKVYEQMLEENPGQAQVAHRLAVVHDKLGHHDRAGELFRQTLADRPADPDVLADYGYSLYLAEEFEEAEPVLRRAIESAPEHRRARVNLGLVLCRLDRIEEAKQAFAQGGLSSDEARMNVAYAMSVEGNLEKARALYAELKETNPNDQSLARRIGQIDSVLARIAEEDRRLAATESKGADTSPVTSPPTVKDAGGSGIARVSSETSEKMADASPVRYATATDGSTGTSRGLPLWDDSVE